MKPGPIPRKCKECGNEFSTWPYVIRNGHGHFCSNKCRKLRAADKMRFRKRQNVIVNNGLYSEFIVENKRGIFSVLVDTEDISRLDEHTWSIGGNGYVYSQRRVEGGIKLLHRFIMDTPPDMDTDHINGNPLDNRKVNLRICTTQQNTHNRRVGSNKSGYKGVSKTRNNTYHATICATHIGAFKTAELAAKAYNIEAVKRYGEFARLNELHE